MTHAVWPELPLSAWKDTYATLHLWTQIVGRIRLAQTPWLNQSWHVVLYATPRGLTTSLIPYGDRDFQLEFDFLNHVLRVSTSDGQQKEIRNSSRALSLTSTPTSCAHSWNLASRFAFTNFQTRFPTRSASARMMSMLRMTANSPNVSGEFSFGRHACLACFAHPSSANAARSISSGEASIWR